MLKQQVTETQAPSLLQPESATAQTVTESAETREPAVVTRPKVKVASRHLPPLYLSRWHWRAVFGVPLLYALVFVTGHRLPLFLRYTDSAAMLQVCLFLVVPVALCLFMGSYLRNRRVAFLSGALVGLSWMVSVWATQQFNDHAPALFARPLGRVTTDLQGTIIAALVYAFFAVASAAVSQSNHGRRTVHDQDRNR